MKIASPRGSFPKTFQGILSWGIRELQILGPEEARASAEWLLTEVSGLERFELILRADSHAPADLVKKFRAFIAGRKKRVPLAYLTGKACFWDEVLEVGPGCLIPRPETEILVEKFLENSGFDRAGRFSFLDLGSGSGAVGIAILRSFSGARAAFSDISEEALEITRNNLSRYGLLERAEIIQSDLFGGFSSDIRWDAIFCNPPYLSEKDWEEVAPELLFEPRRALDGGEDGLDFYRRIKNQAPRFLNPEGRLVLETGIRQAQTVAAWLGETRFFKNIQIFKDHAGIERVVMSQLLG